MYKLQLVTVNMSSGQEYDLSAGEGRFETYDGLIAYVNLHYRNWSSLVITVLS